MDPLSATASAIAVLQISGTVISACYNYRSLVKGSRTDASRITTELNGLRTVIESLLSLFENDAQDESAVLKSLSQINGPLENCLKDLETVVRKLVPKEGWKAAKTALVWPLREAEVRRILDGINSTKSTIQLALLADQSITTTAIKDSVELLNQQFESHSLETGRNDILKWLAPPNVGVSHTAARKKCQSTTGQWFLRGTHYKQWLDEPKSFLWLNGIPGCGKTVLSSTIIEDVFRHSERDPDIILLFFYFDFNDSGRNTAEAFIRSIISQIQIKSSETPEALQKLYSQTQSSPVQPSMSSLLEVLEECLRLPRSYHLVIDALDECTELEDLLNILGEIHHRKSTNLRIVLTSRQLAEIEKSMATASANTLCVNENISNDDISVYIADKLASDAKLSKWPHGIRGEIYEILSSRACGMFRWAACQIDSLRKCLTTNQVRAELHTLPKTLDETYDRILLGIDECNRENAVKILRWLAFAARPVTLEEMAEMLAIDPTGPPFYNESHELLDSNDAASICSTLVTITKVLPGEDYDLGLGYGQYELKTQKNEFNSIRLAHLSVKDYILSDRIKSGNCAAFSLDVVGSHQSMAQTCIGYLLRPPFSIEHVRLNRLSAIKDLLNAYPLYYYCAHYWPLHIKKSGETLDLGTWSLLQQFFRTKSCTNGGNFATWAVVLTPSINLMSIQETEPLYYAASFGITSLIRKLVETDPALDIERTGGRYESSPLQVATYRNRTESVKLLLEMGANPHSKNSDGTGTLTWAILGGNEEIQRLLEDYGAGMSESDLEDVRCMWYMRET